MGERETLWPEYLEGGLAISQEEKEQARSRVVRGGGLSGIPGQLAGGQVEV